MHRRDERKLAARLARVLDGEPAEGPDVAALAALLERATEPVRFDVRDEEVERALAAVRPRVAAKPARPVRPPRIAVAFVAAAAAAAAVLAITFLNLPGVDVSSKALAAVSPDRGILRLDEHIVPAHRGVFPPSERITWFDARDGRLYALQFTGTTTIETTLVEPGRVLRYDPDRNIVVTGRTCRALEGGCPVDPVEFYRRALQAGGAVRSRKTGKGYLITLPVQSAGSGVSIEQQALVDARTFLPRRITWLERRGDGALRPVSVIHITSIQRIPRGSPELQGTFTLSLPEGVRVIQRVAPGRPLRQLSARPLDTAQLARVRPAIRWLGRSFDGRPLRRAEKITWNAGVAYRLGYRGLIIWNYTSVIPPDLAPGRLGAEVKPVPALHGVARFYGSRTNHLVLELDVGGRSIAVVAPSLYKQQLLRVLSALKPLR